MKTKANCLICGETDTEKFWFIHTSGKYYSYCKLCQKERRKKYYQENRADMIIDTRIRREALRPQALIALGGECIVCGIDDFRILEIDHVRGDGYKDRRGGQKRAMFRRIIEGRNHDSFQILCANHHKIKSSEDRKAKPPRNITYVMPANILTCAGIRVDGNECHGSLYDGTQYCVMHQGQIPDWVFD